MATHAIIAIVVERDDAIESMADRAAHRIDAIGARDINEIVAGDVTDEIARAADARDDVADEVAGLADDRVCLGVPVVVVERFEIIEIEVARDGAAFANWRRRAQATLDLCFDGVGAGQLCGR